MVAEEILLAEKTNNESDEKELAKFKEYLLQYGATTEHILKK